MLVAGTWVSLPTLTQAQIAPYVNERGKLVYVNGDSPGHHRGSTISPTPGKRPAAPDLAAASPELPSGDSEDRLDRIVREAAERHSLDPALVKAVIRTESGWNPRAVSRKGAIGLMQLIPGTAQRYGVGNPYDPAQNVEGGTTYLRALLDRYNGDLTRSLAAYNAGERAVDESRGVPAIRETRRYVQKVTDAYFQPGSDSSPAHGSPRRTSVRREVNSKGRVVFTNE
ncbi:MAG: lytic transglycosylase domain-containing protein [Acidobacteriia bacterium]|nr:lytic transglycosylase domain-containing protein [Terriglobia bacterium]